MNHLASRERRKRPQACDVQDHARDSLARGSENRKAGSLGPDHVDLRGPRLVLELMSRGGERSYVAEIRQINAGGDETAAISQHAEAHHAQGAARVSYQLEELIPDPFAKA